MSPKDILIYLRRAVHFDPKTNEPFLMTLTLTQVFKKKSDLLYVETDQRRPRLLGSSSKRFQNSAGFRLLRHQRG